MIMLIYLNTALFAFIDDIFIKGANIHYDRNIIYSIDIIIYIIMNLIAIYFSIKRFNRFIYQIIIAYNLIILGISYYYDYEIKKGNVSVITFSIVALLLFNIYSYFRLSKIKD